MLFYIPPPRKKNHMGFGQVTLKAAKEKESHLEKHTQSNELEFQHLGTHGQGENEVEHHLADKVVLSQPTITKIYVITKMSYIIIKIMNLKIPLLNNSQSFNK